MVYLNIRISYGSILTKPDIWITVIAGVLYFIQAVVSSKTMPQEQRQMGYMMMVISPIMII